MKEVIITKPVTYLSTLDSYIVENNEMEIRCEAAVQQAAQLTRLWKQRAAGVCGKMVIYDKEAARAKVRNPAQEPDPRRYAEAKRGLQVYD